MSAGLAMIAALAGPSRVIGLNGRLPWRLADDMAWFRCATMGKTVVMGRRTWDSLHVRPLPGRRNIVLTRDPGRFAAEPGVAFTDDPDAALAGQPRPALAIAGELGQPGLWHGLIQADIVVVGGATLYRLGLPKADELALTWLPGDVPGDCHFPAFDRLEWRERLRRYLPAGPSAFLVSARPSPVPRRVTVLSRR